MTLPSLAASQRASLRSCFCTPFAIVDGNNQGQTILWKPRACRSMVSTTKTIFRAGGCSGPDDPKKGGNLLTRGERTPVCCLDVRHIPRSVRRANERLRHRQSSLIGINGLFPIGAALDTPCAVGITGRNAGRIRAIFDVGSRIIFLAPGRNVLHVKGDDFASSWDFLL